MTNSTHRLFFALTPADSWLSQLQDLQRELNQHDWSRYIRWTPLDNFHITLRFVGQCDNELAQFLWQQLGDQIIPLHYRLLPVRISLFPGQRRPVVLALNLQKTEALEQLVNCINGLCDDAGLTPERNSYRPHLTLGRVKQRIPDPAKEKIATLLEDSLHLPPASVAASLQMLHSDTRPDGAVYTALASQRLE